MKKLILSSLAMASLAYAAHAVTNMCVEQSDGTIVRYDVDKVKQVYYEESSESTTDQGATVSGKVGIYTYVDLGLPSGTKWATYNVGATKPTEYGDYFAWGETKPKEDYSCETYKWCNGDYESLTKYNTKSDYGTVDNKKVLDAEDDAATANWGSAWRMPTLDEIIELVDGCDWKWVEDFNGSGVNGQLGTSMKNGATIFLPAAGIRDGTDLDHVGDYGNSWSSSLYENAPVGACSLSFEDVNCGWSFHNLRNSGRSVRAVLDERKVYVVSFYDADSVLIESQKVREGMSADKVVAPKKDGYKFVGWSDSSFVNVKENLKIYALYEENVTVSGKVGLYTYVDLGLESGTKWATYNVGATKPTEYGDYFAWGETKPKEDYGWSTYKWCENKKEDGKYVPQDFTKYNTNSDYGTVDNKMVLEAEDDAATANWGSAWRMPTTEEQSELLEGCDWEWVEDFNGSGVNGQLGTSKKNGATIFLPAAGGPYDPDLYAGSYGDYWSSSLHEDYLGSAYDLFFQDNYIDRSHSYRYTGRSVRAVLR